MWEDVNRGLNMLSSGELCCIHWIINYSRLHSILESTAVGGKCSIASIGENMNLGKFHYNFKSIFHSFLFEKKKIYLFHCWKQVNSLFNVIWSLNIAVCTWPDLRFDHTEGSWCGSCIRHWWVAAEEEEEEGRGRRNLDVLNVLWLFFLTDLHCMDWNLSQLSSITPQFSAGSSALTWKALGRCSSCTIGTEKDLFFPSFPRLCCDA